MNFILLCRNYAKGIYYMELCVILKRDKVADLKYLQRCVIICKVPESHPNNEEFG